MDQYTCQYIGIDYALNFDKQILSVFKPKIGFGLGPFAFAALGYNIMLSNEKNYWNWSYVLNFPLFEKRENDKIKFIF